MNALPVILVVGATLPMVLWMIWSAIKATRTPPRNKRRKNVLRAPSPQCERTWRLTER